MDVCTLHSISRRRTAKGTPTPLDIARKGFFVCMPGRSRSSLACLGSTTRLLVLLPVLFLARRRAVLGLLASAAGQQLDSGPGLL
jgi:hypothetical protein